MNTILKIIIGISAAVFGISGLCMTLCGGVFTFASIQSWNPQLLMLALSSFAAGLLALWGTYKYIKAMFGSPNSSATSVANKTKEATTALPTAEIDAAKNQPPPPEK